MKYPLLAALAAAFFLSACTGTDTAHSVAAKTAQAVPQAPEREIDSRIRLNAAGVLEVLEEEGWQPQAEKGLPTQVIWPDLAKPTPAPLQAFSEGSDGYLGVATTKEIYLSADSGTTWAKILDKDTLKNGTYLTSLAVHPADPLTILAGSSFSGLFQTRDQGKTWQDLSANFFRWAPGADYWEHFHALSFSRMNPDILYASMGVRGELLSFDLKTRGVKSLGAVPQGEIAQALLPRTIGGTEILEIRTPTAYWRLTPGKDAVAAKPATAKTPAVAAAPAVAPIWQKLSDRAPRAPWTEAKTQRMAKAANRQGLYVSGNQAAIPSHLDRHLAMLKDRGMNSLVVDFKDDTGLVLWDSKVPMAVKTGAVRPRLPVAEIVKKVHDQGYYLIARFVVFKDEKLYRYENYKYALWDRVARKPWGEFRERVDETTKEVTYVQKEFWVDVFSQDVWDYNIALAKELQGLGIDEIQFDYIRFPSDGPTGRILHRHAVAGMSKANALESFLKKAREEITLPLSTDIFGFNGFYPMEHLGQNAPMISRYVDAISPMFYPSHFSQDFYGRIPYIDRSQIIYDEGTLRSRLMTGNDVHIRPWVQAFLLGDERKFTDTQIVTYLRNQLKGTVSGGGSGWLLWNAANNYYMVREDLSPYATTVK